MFRLWPVSAVAIMPSLSRHRSRMRRRVTGVCTLAAIDSVEVGRACLVLRILSPYRRVSLFWHLNDLVL
jgi:hypothetical protein